MAETIKIDGLRELKNALLKLPEKLGEKVLNGALYAGAKLVVDDAKVKVPVRTGELRRNIRARRATKKQRGDLTAAVVVGVRRLTKKQIASIRKKKGRENASDAFYWRFLEFGTSKMAARPFLRPAFESRKTAAALLIKDEIRKRIEKEAKLLGKRLFI